MSMDTPDELARDEITTGLLVGLGMLVATAHQLALKYPDVDIPALLEARADELDSYAPTLFPVALIGPIGPTCAALLRPLAAYARDRAAAAPYLEE